MACPIGQPTTPKSMDIGGSQPGPFCPQGTYDKAWRCCFHCRWGDATGICKLRPGIMLNLLQRIGWLQQRIVWPQMLTGLKL